MTETTLVRSILDQLEARGVWAFRMNAGERPHEYKGKVGRIKLAPPGTPDIFVILPPGGRLGGLEVKTLKGKQRPSQATWQAKAEAHGVRYAVVRSAAEAIQHVKEWSR